MIVEHEIFRHMKRHIVPTFGLAILAGVALMTPAFSASNFAYVSIGNAGNADDAATGSLYGAVAYAYKIAQNETTISHYAQFLNAVAATDTYSLYNTGMATSSINGISQNGVSGSFTYSVNPGSGNKPITYVSWFDAARYTNWLHNGQPGGAQDAASTENGAYTLNGAMSGIIAKNGGAKAWIPTESEWYKAAYYDPNKDGVGVGGYWQHPNQSNTLTSNDIGVAGAANHYDADGFATYTGGTSWGITDVGAYGMNSDSAYGTNDQAGNVWEWNDAVISMTSRGLRGGSWYLGSGDTSSSITFDGAPTGESEYVGFRVASVPEPTSIFLTMLASGVMLIRRKR
jgi:formylglycine-generating enzyme required for sulfatase activity